MFEKLFIDLGESCKIVNFHFRKTVFVRIKSCEFRNLSLES